MAKSTKRESYLNEIEELKLLFKSKSKELVLCNSLSKEMKIKEEMAKLEVQKKVIKRKLAAIELENEVSA